MPDRKKCELFCHRPRLIVTDVWQTCEKIRAAVFRAGLDLWSYYRKLDPNNNCLISEAQFVSILAGPMKESLGLTANEISQLTDYFRVYDGRIYYTQFCEIIHSNVRNICQNPKLATGLEWTEPYKVCRLTETEEIRVSMLLTKIATLVNRRHLILQPYFQDYELIAKSGGTVTKNHFARVLAYLNIKVSADEFRLLLKKFGYDAYTVNYVAFIGALDDVIRALRDQGAVDVGGDLLPHFPGHALCAPLPVLPRPEINLLSPPPNVSPGPAHPCARPAELLEALRRLQCFLLKHRVCAESFFKAFDWLGTGRVTEAQFRRCLDKMTAAAPQRMCMAQDELDRMVAAYHAPNDPDRVCYRTLLQDLACAFAPEDVAKCCQANAPVAVPPPADDPRHVLREHPRRSPCEETMSKIQLRVRERHLHMKPAFLRYDPCRTSHVSVPQMRQAIMALGMLLTPEELQVLEGRFCDDMGFNYEWFLEEVAPRDPEEALMDHFGNLMTHDPKPFPYPSPTVAARDVVEILAKLKCRVVREGVNVLGTMMCLDPNDEGHISRRCFCQAMGECGLRLSACELETLMDAFGTPGRPDHVDYKRFAKTVQRAVRQPCLERAPMVAPLEQMVRQPDKCRNFLNFDERFRAGRALQKLGNRPYMELEQAFLEHDQCRTGVITPAEFRCVMHKNGLYHLLSTPEIAALVKCFGVKHGIEDDFDYRSFCHAINILQVHRRRRIL